MIGKKVSHYKILEKLGGGGMGVVYKAEDTKLKRHVALKFLPPELTRDDEAKDRFIHEARSASALDHQHICTVYEINETDDGQTFIAMAYCEGETLKQRIARGPLPPPEAVEIAIQISEGLAKAHEKEIVHRDIKPANVMLVEDGKVKIVDFGLAKMAGVSKITKAGTTLGTVSYMSPEQARGDPVDHRADIWALGVVFYEMLAGQTPFKGEYEQAVLYSILNTEPEPVTTFQPDLPFDFQYLIKKALEKNPKDRYQSINGLLVDLRRLQRDTSKVVQVPPPGIGAPEKAVTPTTTAVTPEPVKRARGLSPLRYAGVAALVVILVVAGYFLLRGIGGPPGPLLTNQTHITLAEGPEDYPAWRPDGNELAYESNQSGNWDIWVTQLTGGGYTNLTEDYTGDDRYPSWSPDGSQIAFWSDREGGGVFRMPARGGPSLRVITGGFNSLCWSADSKEIACVRSMSDSVVIVNLQTADKRHLQLPGRKGENGRSDLSWSPDARFFAYWVALISYREAPNSQVWIMRLEDGVGIPITDGTTKDWSPTWAHDSSNLYFVSNRGGIRDLWQQRIGSDGSPVGSPRQLTHGLEILFARFSPDGQKLACSRGGPIGNIWRIPILGDRPATWSDAEQLTSERARLYGGLDISNDGKRLVFDSQRDGKRHLWVLPLEGGDLYRVTSDPMEKILPRWSPDDREIVFVAAVGGNRDIYKVSVDDGKVTRLTHDEAVDHGPEWSPDGKEIAFISDRSGNWDIWVIPAEGGQARQLTDHPASDGWPDWSPDGEWILFWSYRDEEYRLWQIPAAGGNPESLTGPISLGGIRSQDGKKIYFRKEGNFWAAPVEGGTEYQLTDLAGRYGGSMGWNTDGKHIYIVWSETQADIWVMDVDWD